MKAGLEPTWMPQNYVVMVHRKRVPQQTLSRALHFSQGVFTMSRFSRLYRRFNPTDAVMLGGLLLDDMMLYSFATKELAEGWDIATDRASGGK